MGSVREKTGVLGVDPFDSPRALRALRRRARDLDAIALDEHEHGRKHRNRPAEM
jgi:hypothetical protein